MTRFQQIARLLFCIPIGCFGLMHVLFALNLGPALTPPWIPFHRAVAGLMGIMLLLGSAGLFTRHVRWAASLLILVFLLAIVFFYLAAIVAHPRDAILRSLAFELVAFSAGCLFLSLDSGHPDSRRLLVIPRLMFAIALIDFGTLHFIFARSFSFLIPPWYPARLTLTIFVGCCFLAAALAMIANLLVRPAAILLGAMFMIIVVTLHLPRVAHNLHSMDEWTSGLVAVAMWGVSWIAAAHASAAVANA